MAGRVRPPPRRRPPSSSPPPSRPRLRPSRRRASAGTPSRPSGSGSPAGAERAARQTVAILRAKAGRAPRDRDLSDLVGELLTNCDDRRRRVAQHRPGHHRARLNEIPDRFSFWPWLAAGSVSPERRPGRGWRPSWLEV
ncbi:hypothetical protein L1785_19015 [Antribacter sp. KLBMP9083]|uniref:MmyB-like transcription regulator ligand binding domain-containing protein n=1 Tax=Antribacter soli TaxID=2910976 RepID=A0AA41QH82_9MICO|nr:hypothetical protein [Antribacter soli]MCF4123068.1 hypothetical protein [Antribacter soli]